METTHGRTYSVTRAIDVASIVKSSLIAYPKTIVAIVSHHFTLRGRVCTMSFKEIYNASQLKPCTLTFGLKIMLTYRMI